MKSLQRDTRIKISYNPIGELISILQRVFKYNKIKKLRKGL